MTVVGKPVDELYLEWLYRQVADPDIQDDTLTYWNILRVLYSKPFVAIVEWDENRIGDAKELRAFFVETEDISTSNEWVVMGCSLLEVMVGLANRLEYLAHEDATPHYWFWELMKNLGLDQYNDATPMPEYDIDEKLDLLIHRQYEPSGVGGFFPLSHVDVDQRELELFTQMSYYLDDIS